MKLNKDLSNVSIFITKCSDDEIDILEKYLNTSKLSDEDNKKLRRRLNDILLKRIDKSFDNIIQIMKKGNYEYL